MEGSGGSWRPAQNDGSTMNMDTASSGDWRTQLQPDARSRIVNKIMDTLQKHLPVYGPENLGELRKIAMRFEEKIFTTAISQTDYLRKISLKMLTMESKTQNTVNAGQMTFTAPNQNAPEGMDMDLVLQSLPDPSLQFVVNYNMNKIESFSDELHNMRKIAEGTIQNEKSQVLLVGKTSKKRKAEASSIRSKGKKAKGSAKKKDAKAKGECFHCGAKGH